ALKTYSDIDGADSPTVARLQGDLADLYQVSQKYEEAEQLYKQALITLTKDYGPHHLVVANVQKSYACLLETQERLEEAQDFYLKALETYIEYYGADDPIVAAIQLASAGVY